MNGYGSHTFKLVSGDGKAVYCKFHYKTDQGIKCLTAQQAADLAGSDPDYAIRDLYNAIESGNFPSWTFYIQVMTFEEAERWQFNPFDVTKVWPQADYPLIPVGRFVLNRNPKNYFAEVEQSAFCPAHFVPGIEPSPDKMLQGRLFSYSDTHRHRLGANYLQLPINAPLGTRVKNFQRDGPMCSTSNQEGAPNYFPNSFSGPEQNMQHLEHRDKASGDITRFNSADEDNFTQVGIFYRKTLSPEARTRLVENIAGHLQAAQPFIQQRAVRNFSRADPEYGRRIQELLDQYKMRAKQASNL
jgi:catalase